MIKGLLTESLADGGFFMFTTNCSIFVWNSSIYSILSAGLSGSSKVLSSAQTPDHMFLSKQTIQKCIDSKDFEIIPYDPANLKEASYTFSLSNKLNINGKEVLMDDDGYELKPNEFVLGCTKEVLKLNNKFCCLLSNRGSIAQLGLNVLLGSNFAEPDTNNPQILELHNCSNSAIKISAGMKVVKGIFGRIE